MLGEVRLNLALLGPPVMSAFLPLLAGEGVRRQHP